MCYFTTSKAGMSDVKLICKIKNLSHRLRSRIACGSLLIAVLLFSFPAGAAGIITKVSAGSSHTLAIKSDGTLWAWGNNYFGQLGDGTNGRDASKSRPVQIGIETTWLQISAGGNHTAAIKSDGTLWTWGYNGYGQLGDNSSTDKSFPVEIPTGVAGTTWKQVVAGINHTIAIQSDGSLWAWGRNNYGQLGIGSSFDSNYPKKVGAATWTYVSAGANHSVAIQSDGTLWVWGYNGFGQLGDGSSSNSRQPKQITIDAGVPTWINVAAGGKHTIAIQTDGSLWAWGCNDSGQLGDGSSSDSNQPKQIGTNWTQVAAGSNYSIGLMKDGTLWTWGDNSSGQLGLGDITTSSFSVPKQIGSETWSGIAAGSRHAAAIKTSDGTLWAWGYNGDSQLGDGMPADKTLPVLVGNTRNWKMIAAGGNSTLAIKNYDGSLWTWGANNYGQLGDGTTIDRNVPEQMNIGTDWVQAAVGGNHMAAIKSDGTMWTWGYNNYGQLGDGTSVNKMFPILVGTNWTQVALGNNHTIAIRADGTLWAWGYNNFGQLGEGTTENRVYPVRIGPDTDWSMVAAGSNQTFAIKSNGTLWAWGNNSDGLLGDGTTADKSTPVQIGSDTDWSGIAVGSRHTVAIKSNGTLWAWGYNGNGQLGDGTYVNKSSPVQIGTDTNWKQVSAGANHTIAIKSDGTLWSWGVNSSGQVGDGSTTDKKVPGQLWTDANSTWSGIAAGSMHTAVLKSNGTLWVWGDNADGQLGDRSAWRESPQSIVLISNNMPSAPTINSPQSGDVFTAAPVLAVSSTSDPDGDRLTYSFELYEDSNLTLLASSISGIANLSGGIISWTTSSLKSDVIYYWRSRANDRWTYGPWSSTGTFVISNGTTSGDVDYSGQVDGYDLILMAVAFGKVSTDSGFNPYADINDDGGVDGKDLLMLAPNIGK